MKILRVVAAFIFSLALMEQEGLVQANFPKSTFFNWGASNSAFSGNGNNATLVLNQFSGSGFQSKKQFLFGSIEMLIKLVPANSAGTVTAYYMSSGGSKHDEIDFEFLGNVSGQPYIIHTNIYTQGVGNREQQFYPWFDPTVDFHNYTIHWNPTQVVWLIDGIAIRVFRNYTAAGIPFPNTQPMRLYSSIWNADNWATRGGLVKIDWTYVPFIARFQQLRLRACGWRGQASLTLCSANTPANWWASPAYKQLSYAEAGRMMWARNKSMIYDYCKDVTRFKGQMPPECSLQQY